MTSFIKTPGIYTQVNINTQRSGLLNNTQKVLFITNDSPVQSTPIAIYDTASADKVFGQNSEAGRMLKAAIKTYQTVEVDCLGKSQNQTGEMIPQK
ncbi:hypothetical protein [Acinetobacter pollinis]|uniref:hypothetical protein n=1 Tax=Acinetobacter pollinis TaxID=2605270 RepID=UPI0018A32828|nr:hypothetical protein [Acinetobacter pollinis]MBF7689580.1 hypothetical protein [Acinetobacter pollinis]MBF7698199.1 hypothetical protein [Acinetobacter pollinis]